MVVNYFSRQSVKRHLSENSGKSKMVFRQAEFSCLVKEQRMVITNDEAFDVLKMKFNRKIVYIAKILDQFIRGTDCLKVHNS